MLLGQEMLNAVSVRFVFFLWMPIGFGLVACRVKFI